MIFYFSSTGNCKYVSQRISEQTGDEILPIRNYIDCENIEIELKPNENLGFVIPTYFGSFPKIVIDFIERLCVKFSGDNYMFFVATYGSRTGNIGVEAQKKIAALGKKLDATFSIMMVDNWNPDFDMTDSNYVRKAEAIAEEQIPHVVSQIASRTTAIELDKTIPTLLQKMALVWYKKAQNTRNFDVSEACVGCGLCERQCPSHTIKIQNGKPSWTKKDCTLCLGCVHRCPVNAISYTESTKAHGQYQNPHVSYDTV